jgi:hypothetical protein
MRFRSNEPHNQTDRDSSFVIAGLFPCLLLCEYLASQQYLFHSVATHLEDARKTKKCNLIDKRHGSRILELTASRPNHISYRKVYFDEFVQNSLGCDMGMIIFDLHGGCYLTAHFFTSTFGSSQSACSAYQKK